MSWHLAYEVLRDETVIRPYFDLDHVSYQDAEKAFKVLDKLNYNWYAIGYGPVDEEHQEFDVTEFKSKNK
jgi:hypothetical protein